MSRNYVKSEQPSPKTIADILRAHKRLCDRVSSFLSVVAEGEARHENWPDPQNYMLLSVYRTAFVLLDNFGLDPVEEEPEDFLLDEEIQRQNALILLTGDAGLSAPVTFECIKAKLLSIEREDSGAYGDVQDIRVSLLTAVRFVIDLEQRE